MSNTSFLTPGDLLADGVVRSTDAAGRADAFLPAPQVQNHAANLAVLPDGALGCVWFAGTQEGVPDISVWFSRLEVGSQMWTTPVQLSDDPTRSEQNPVLFVRDSGVIWLLWTSQHAGNQDTARVLRRISNDGGVTWGDAHVLIPESDAGGVFVRQPVVETASGRLLLPVFHCVKIEGRKWVGDRDYSGVMISDDDGATWREAVVPESVGCVHMDVVVRPDASLVALYRSRWADFVYRSISTDDGETWTAPVPTELPNNNSSVQAVGLADGGVALVYNHSSALDATSRRTSLYDEIDDDGLADGSDVTVEAPVDDGDARSAFWGAPRAPMTLAVSRDGGLTWPIRRNLDEGDGYCLTNNSRDGSNREFSYPSIAETADGRIHVVYTYFRQAIKYVRLERAWIGESQ
ncbi:glycosyl hydrolase [Rhodococcus sp. 06-156-3C]|uniref:sialidase family protein n=1 Tax=Nocardiaceae TaxID=85025 RepID=UPI000522FEC1|nr:MULTISPECIES: exo-alpha-sialidase [Rhodococcus]OZD09031.1 glycosyl hydrolase [Rhodococcus sp. 06-156-4C]OZD12940.1 glycosyl hydrolase [Rhodococcus sp. 06-156-3C]OZD28000.1 glycosyl hydrolase [Rhodococcus sp. 06-156-4a]OZD32490.1 glycosyl hydrolase [Rhodococcus sp. 06-156-3b]OZD34486.1 glycosyl hydrolase [Rhodococcus sp. 06-156-3]